MLHRGRIVGMLGLPLTTQRVVVMWQQCCTPVRCVFGARNGLNAAAERGAAAGRQQAEAIVCLFKQR